MKKYLFGLLLMSVISQPVLAMEQSLSKATVAVSEILHGSVESAQVLLDARDEASAFSFSDGVLRGRALGDALSLIRSEKPRLQASDMDLAIAILQAN